MGDSQDPPSFDQYLLDLGRWAHEGGIHVDGPHVAVHVSRGGQAVIAHMDERAWRDIADLNEWFSRKPDPDDYGADPDADI